MENEWKKREDLYFDSDASLIRKVGRESISNQVVALIELIKNSYDADASKVEIIFEEIKYKKGRIRIIDTGNGMTLEDLEKKWMILAIPDKEKNPLTPNGRIKIGEKGIGRIGLEGLSEKLIIVSKPKGELKKFKIEIDWSEYKPGTLLNKISNKFFESNKGKNEKGVEIILEDLLDRWDEEKIQALRKQVELITPLGIDVSFSVNIQCSEYCSVSGKVESSFLKKNIFHFKAEIDKSGKIKYWMKQNNGKIYSLAETDSKSKCGPTKLDLYFFYRISQRYPDETMDFSKLFETLDNYGGIKLYRDNFLVKLEREDWLDLDQMRVQDPSWTPGTNQVFGIVSIGKIENPEIKDTTNREGLMKNDAYFDLMKFLKNSILIFKVFRKQAEIGEDGKKKKDPQKSTTTIAKKDVKKFKQKKSNVVEEVFLNFTREYPNVFYRQLEDEINECKKYQLPNATFILCRKMIENLLYNILEKKYPSQREIWWDLNKKRPLFFSILLENIKNKKDEFEDDEKELIEKLISLIVPYLKVANQSTHRIMEYLEDIDSLKKYKVSEIIQILTILYKKLK